MTWYALFRSNVSPVMQSKSHRRDGFALSTIAEITNRAKPLRPVSAKVQAPYQGALWTPGYWGYWHHRYGFYRGYWGPHIGFYGGVNYGFGYIGIGYQGGYWGGGHFNYNRSVNNVNISVVHNVYNRGVVENNRGGARVSFNGVSGGLQTRARPAELAARRETHSAPMNAQVQNERVASTNRAQFAHGNQGRPASLVVSQPLAADRTVRAPAALQGHNQAETQQHNSVETHSHTAQPMNVREPARNQPVQNQKNERQPGRNATSQNGISRTAPVQQPQQQRQAAPQQQRQAAPQQQRQAATAQAKPEEHPKK